jgi:histidine triad (HIT) family protein
VASIFTRVLSGEIPGKIVAQYDGLAAIEDINPQAPTHILIVPIREIVSINDLAPGDAALVGKMVLMGKQLAEERGFAEDGYRLVFNVGDDGGQTVDHIHLHLLGGRAMAWPPG